MRITRLARIVVVALKHGLDEFALGHERTRALRPIVNACLFWRDLSSPRAVRLRQALEDLGPIFVKFGQMLSTRRDLLPTDIADELDLTREAANCSQLRRNFQHSPLLRVPEVHWDWTDTDVFVMERMAGIPIGRIDELPRAGIDLKRLSRAGVEIFFTQVFRDGFFHADMHPGNIFVAVDPTNHGKYISLDFGIMGTLSERDKSYLAQNFLAFFRRDYHRVATAHIESGWVPPDTRIDELESEIRVVCEPIFDRPLKEISLAKVLVQLFKASRRFNVEIQTQLVLLQKTLLNVEGLGRQLDPDLDLWVTAKPFLERWMRDQIGLRALERRLREEVPFLATALPQLPRLIHQKLTAPALPSDVAFRELAAAQRAQNGWLALLAVLLAGVIAILLWHPF